MPADREIDARIEGVLKIEDIIAATGGQVICSNAHAFSGVSIDSRSIRKGELFIALKGERFDGKENAMNAPVFVLLFTLLRLVIPFGLILLIGEWVRRREAKYWLNG